MNENETFVAEATENVEQTTEEIATEPAKMFTQEDMDKAVGKAKARERAKVTRQFERKYGDLEGVLKAGTGEEDVGKMTDTFREFYSSKGIKMPDKPQYDEKDVAVLAEADANEIIRGGFDDVVEEADRLKDIGVENMTAREKAVFLKLANHIKTTETSRELSAIGVTEDVYDSKEFKDFAAKFSKDVPIRDVYDIYVKMQPKKNIKPMGSMKQSGDSGVKDYYSPEEIERLSMEDLDDPRVWDAVRRSMTGG